MQHLYIKVTFGQLCQLRTNIVFLIFIALITFVVFYGAIIDVKHICPYHNLNIVGFIFGKFIPLIEAN
jgi:hypothetical protein